MTGDLLQLLGGVGLFLLGMIVMTDGLKDLAGDYLQTMLARFTNGPVSGAATGAATTALLQSSSATTVAAVGFVSAGLLTFPQALGVIFGANVGTTITGWLVALLGLKLQIGTLVFPLVLIGVLIRLFMRGNARHAGLALAGFALVFLGIDNLQQGMAGYQGLVTPSDFPGDDLAGRLQLRAIGIAITLVTQSSSAGVATALTAVHTGTLSFSQAAVLVIGMDVGTTVTAAVATLGGSVDTRRTGYSHVVYNLLTAALAMLLLVPYVWVWEAYYPVALQQHAELALVGFHTLFNALGVLLILPFTGQFAALMHRLVAAPQDPLLDRLDRRLLENPVIALDTVAQVVVTLTRDIFAFVSGILRQIRPNPLLVDKTAHQLAVVRAYVDHIHLQPEQARSWQRLMATIHLLDHLQRLHLRCSAQHQRGLNLDKAGTTGDSAKRFATDIDEVMSKLRVDEFAAASAISASNAERLISNAARMREETMADVGAGILDVPDGTSRLDSIRWLRRVAYHVWRVCVHLGVLATGGKNPD